MISEHAFCDGTCEEGGAGLGIEQARSKLKVLNEYDKEKRTKELQLNIKKAMSEERRAKAAIELEEPKRQRSGRPRRALSDAQQKALESLGQAFEIDETIRRKLEQISQDGKSDEPQRKEITDSTNQLEALLDQAEAENARARFDAVKTAIKRAADQ